MSRIPLEEMTGRIRSFLEQSTLAKSLRGVEVEPAYDLDDETLWVTVALHKPEKVDEKDAVKAVRGLRLDMMTDDDRFLIVRFAEAA